MRRVAIVVLMAVGIASCAWPMAGQGPDRRAWNGTERAFTPTSVAQVRDNWSVPANFGQEVVGDRHGVFFRSKDLLQALDPATGTERWHAAVTGTSVPGLVGDGVVVAVDGPSCTVRRLTASTGAPQASATIGYAYGANATTRSCTAARSVLTDNGRIAVSTASSATFAFPGCGGTPSNQLWGAATTVSVLDDTLHPVWTATDATIGCGTPPATSPVALFGDVTRTRAHYVVPQGNDVVAFPQSCTTPCAPAWRATFGGPVHTAVALPGGRIGVGAAFTPFPVIADSNGGALWTGATGAAFGFAATDTTIFFASSFGLVAYPIDGCGAPTCAPAWTAPLGGRIPLFPPVVAGDVVILPTWETSGLFFDARGCAAATCTALPGQAPAFDTQGAVSVINGRIYAANAGRGLLTFVVAPA